MDTQEMLKWLDNISMESPNFDFKSIKKIRQTLIEKEELEKKIRRYFRIKYSKAPTIEEIKEYSNLDRELAKRSKSNE